MLNITEEMLDCARSNDVSLIIIGRTAGEDQDNNTNPGSYCLTETKTIKVVIIGLLILLLMIPMFMIENLISERGRTQEEAIDEVSEKSDNYIGLVSYSDDVTIEVPIGKFDLNQQSLFKSK